MSLGALLVDLHGLLADPEKNSAAIYRLLGQNQDLAEYEVARFLVAKAMAPSLATRLRSIDPRERLEAVRTVLLVCTRSSAAKLLRPLVKDPDPTARKHARHAVRKLAIADVALKDPRFDPSKNWRIGPFTPGAYNPSGWAFGVYKRKIPPRRLGRLTSRDDVIELLGTACPPDMSRFLPELRRLAILESDDTSGLPEIEFIDAWRSASATSLFRGAQDQIVDREYYEPAMRCADRLGIETPLARAQLYDAAIQHGVGGDPDSLGAMIKRTIALSDGAARVEASWLNDFFDVRITTLRSPTNSATASVWRDSVDRVECMRRLAVLGNFNLVGPFEAEVFGLRFMIT